jgi:MscS family membrane protein
MTQLFALLSTEIPATGNNVGNVLAFGGALFSAMVLARLVHWVFQTHLRRLVARSDTHLDDALLEALERPVELIVLGAGIGLASQLLQVPEELRTFGDHIATVIITVFIAWGMSRSVDAFRGVVIDPWVAATETKLDDQIVPILDKTVKVVIWSMAILTAFTLLGYDVLSLLTGLGIGGVAVAMAAQATLSNVFGSISIFADQPFQVDDLVQVGPHVGVVFEVGLRTVRMRTLKGQVVTIPNHSVVSNPVVCLSSEGTWRHDGKVGLVYSTSHARLEQAMQAIQQTLAAHPRILDNHTVRFMDFGDSALEIRFAWFLERPEPAAYLNTISDVNLAIKARFDEEGWEMAYPTMTLYHVSASGAQPRMVSSM